MLITSPYEEHGRETPPHLERFFLSVRTSKVPSTSLTTHGRLPILDLKVGIAVRKMNDANDR